MDPAVNTVLEMCCSGDCEIPIIHDVTDSDDDRKLSSSPSTDGDVLPSSPSSEIRTLEIESDAIRHGDSGSDAAGSPPPRSLLRKRRVSDNRSEENPDDVSGNDDALDALMEATKLNEGSLFTREGDALFRSGEVRRCTFASRAERARKALQSCSDNRVALRIKRPRHASDDLTIESWYKQSRRNRKQQHRRRVRVCTSDCRRSDDLPTARSQTRYHMQPGVERRLPEGLLPIGLSENFSLQFVHDASAKTDQSSPEGDLKLPSFGGLLDWRANLTAPEISTASR